MKMKKGFLGILLSLVMVLGLMPGMSMTAYAWDGDPYASLVNTTKVITFDNKQWYLIENNSTAANAGTVTLLAKECVGASQFDFFNNTYSDSKVETFVNNWYSENITVNAKTAVNGGMFLLTTAQANAMMIETRKCSKASGANFNYWWLCSPGVNGNYAACVGGDIGDMPADGAGLWLTLGVRPALKLNLESVIFDSKSNTFSLGSPTVYDPYTTSIPTATEAGTCYEQHNYDYVYLMIAKQGWVKDYAGWHYYDRYGKKIRNEWLLDNGSWYFLDSEGTMATGWLWDGNHWYYLDYASGIMQTGWIYDNGSWYYLSDSGEMQTGWLYQGDVWYYFDDSGAMAADGRWIDGTYYEFAADGAWIG